MLFRISIQVTWNLEKFYENFPHTVHLEYLVHPIQVCTYEQPDHTRTRSWAIPGTEYTQ